MHMASEVLYSVVMIYSGKEAAVKMEGDLAERVAKLGRSPVLAIVSVGAHPSTASFIKIKRVYAEKIGVTIKEFNFPAQENEAPLVSEILDLAESSAYDGIIVQLPLPLSYDTKRVLDAIPAELDVDVLGSSATHSFEKAGTPVPPVAGAVAHILHDTDTGLEGKNVVIIGRGRLVGTPVATWFIHQGVTPRIVDINTDEEKKLELYKEADIVVTGIGTSHLLKPEFFKQGVVLIDAGTSEQGGVLSGDCDPACSEVASVFTPVPGGVGPLTVACLFRNLMEAAEKRK
jgi:5,10-methylene-tetrahydrofolate dehydrogenase/methenyl tetrahydrofolate cyclohydrolase